MGAGPALVVAMMVLCGGTSARIGGQVGRGAGEADLEVIPVDASTSGSDTGDDDDPQGLPRFA